MSRTKLIAALHVAAKEAGLDEETRRDRMAVITGGKRSAKDCTDTELAQVVAALRGPGPARRRADSPVARKARALWISLHALGQVSDPSEKALAAFVKRQHGVEDLAFVRADKARPVLNALKDWATRAGVDWTADANPRLCVLWAQWRLLEAAGQAPAATLSAYCQGLLGTPLVRSLSDRDLDRVIGGLAKRVQPQSRRDPQSP